MSIYSIQPFSADPAVSMKMSVIGLELNSSATIGVRFFNSSGASIFYKEVVCAGQDYANWGDSDEYLVNFVCQKLGVIINSPAPIPEPDPVVIPEPDPVVIPEPDPVVIPEPDPIAEP